VGLVCAITGCSGDKPGAKGGTAGGTAGGSGASAGSTGNAPTNTPTIPVPDGGIAAPTATTTLALSTVPDLGIVNYIANRSSVRLYLPGIMGARDYRVFAVEAGVTATVNDGKQEHIDGATLFCGGLHQRNQCNDDEILPVTYNNDLLDMPRCEAAGDPARRPNVPSKLMQTLEVDGLKPNTTLVVEALDRQCPFPGLVGLSDRDIKIANVDIGPAMSAAVVNDQSYMLQLLPGTFPVRTEAEIRAQYGSMIFNGEGPNQPTLDPKSPAFPESPYIRIGQPAPPDDPIVLARSVVSVSPSGDATPLEGFSATDYFDDFDDDTDQPVLLRNTDPSTDVLGGTVNVYTTKKWVFYDAQNEFSDFFVDRGQLNEVMGDPSQDSMSVQAMYPKRPVQLPTLPDEYLHVTYEAQRVETSRRYENLTLCGSDEMGKTYNGETPIASPRPHPGFMDVGTTARTSTEGWNCLYLVGRGPGYYEEPGGDIMSHSDTSLKVTVVKTQTPVPQSTADYDTLIPQFATVYGPTQEPPFPVLWERQIDDSGMASGMWLDDQMNAFQRTRFDVFIRRDRVVIYVEGEQRICQELDPTAMTMAEGALGFWHILYHTSAEFNDLRQGFATANPRTGQHNILHNVPFGDQRTYDNVGFQENVGLPANFDSMRCYTAVTPTAM
jgi:hypothetical protein